MNGVLTEGMARRVSAEVLDQVVDPSARIVDPTFGSPATGTSIIEDDKTDLYLSAMVDGVFELDDQKLAYHPPAAAVDPARIRTGFFQQIGLFLVWAFWKLLWAPVWIARWFRRLFTGKLNEATHGDAGYREVSDGEDKRFDLRDRTLLAIKDRILAAEQRARRALRSPATASAIRSTPRLWTNLREMVFGALDGSSDLSALGFVPVDGKIPVFGRVTDVLVAPHSAWEAPEGALPPGMPRSVAGTDTGEVAAARAAIVSWVTEAKNAHGEAQNVVSAAIEQHLALLTALDDVVATLFTDGQIDYDESGAPQLVKATKWADDDPDAERIDGLRAEFKSISAKVAALDRQRPKLDAAVEATAEVIDERDAVLESLDQWISSRQQSFFWRVSDRMAAQRQALQHDLDAFVAAVEGIVVPEPNELVKLRKRFHRRWLISWLIVAAVTTLLVLLPEWFPEIRDAAPWYPAASDLIWIGIGVGLFILLLLLLAYYRGWSAFERRVRVQIARLEAVEEGVAQIRQEQLRLDSLHAQARTWLELLSAAIHRPWALNPAWRDGGTESIGHDGMPFAMQLAQPDADDKVANARLRRDATAELLVRGWRAQAFSDLLEGISESLGLPQDKFGITALDSDLPHASNNTRAILAAHLGDEPILRSVAATRLRSLISTIQSANVGARPRVTRIGADPFSNLDSDFEHINERSDAVPWDDFLRGELVGRDNPVTPLSALGIAELEIREGHHHKVSSYLVVPERLAAELEFPDVTTVTFPSRIARPLDFVLRIDMVSAPGNAIRLLNKRQDDS